MSEIKMNYQVAAAIYDSYLYNLNNVGGFSLKEIFDAYYRSKKIDPTKRDDDFIKFTSMINEAQNDGKRLGEITKYLNQRYSEEVSEEVKRDLEEARKTSKREEKTISIIEDGNERGVRLESTAFDPSGKSNVSSKFGSSDFEFNDDSTKYLNPEKEEGYMNSKIAAKAGDKNTSTIFILKKKTFNNVFFICKKYLYLHLQIYHLFYQYLFFAIIYIYLGNLYYQYNEQAIQDIHLH